MYLYLYIDNITNKILSKIPSEELSVSIGDIIDIDSKKYSITEYSSEEFIDYELIVVSIMVSESKEDNNGLY